MSDLKKKKLFLLDMDGTLIDSNGIWKDVDIRFLERRGMEYSKAYYEGVNEFVGRIS